MCVCVVCGWVCDCVWVGGCVCACGYVTVCVWVGECVTVRVGM